MTGRGAAVSVVLDSPAQNALVLAQRHDRGIARARLDAAPGKILAHLQGPRACRRRFSDLIREVQALVDAAIARTTRAYGRGIFTGIDACGKRREADAHFVRRALVRQHDVEKLVDRDLEVSEATPLHGARHVQLKRKLDILALVDGRCRDRNCKAIDARQTAEDRRYMACELQRD